MTNVFRIGLWVAAALMGAAGCVNGPRLEPKAGPAPKRVAVPAPIDLMLPKKIEFHPFTERGVRSFDDRGGIRGMEVLIQATDAHGDAAKAYGAFRVEMYTHRDQAGDPKGKRAAIWDIDLLDPKANRRHWQKISRAYKFLLEWDTPIPVGQRYVLQAVYTSPFTPRLITEQVFVSGQ